MASGLGTESAKVWYGQDRKAPVEDQMALGSEGKVDKGVASRTSLQIPPHHAPSCIKPRVFLTPQLIIKLILTRARTKT